MRDHRAHLVAAALLVLAFGVAAPASAQVDFSGTWSLDVETSEPVPVGASTPALDTKLVMDPCVYSGTVVLTQVGDAVSGPAELVLVSGPASCPAEMTGMLMGTLSSDGMGGFLIDGTIEGSDPTGTTSFSGTISPNPGGNGDLTVTKGDFAGTGGTWSAVLQQFVLEVPTLGPIGLGLLTLLLLGAGAWILARQPA